jgi:hypothetical protein
MAALEAKPASSEFFGTPTLAQSLLLVQAGFRCFGDSAQHGFGGIWNHRAASADLLAVGNAAGFAPDSSPVAAHVCNARNQHAPPGSPVLWRSRQLASPVTMNQ